MTVEPTTHEASSSDEDGGATHRLDDSPVHGTTLNGLEEAGIKTAEDVLEYTGDLLIFDAANKLSELKGVGKKGAWQVVDWIRDEIGWDRDYASESEEHSEFDEIRCPHCEGLFDRVADDEPDYEPGMARCEDDLGEGTEEIGDCGRRFWLQPTEEGHETYEEPPEDAGEREEDDENGSASEENVAADDTSDGPSEFHSEEIDPEEEPEARKPQEAEDPPHREHDENDSPESEDDSDGSFWPDESPEPPREEPEPPSVPPAERVHPDLPDCCQLGRAEHDSEQWHHIRSQGVGSSDVGAILGFSDHATAQDIWASKVDGEEADEKPWLEGFAKFGTWFEAYIREWCEQEHGATILPGRQLGTLRSVRWEKAVANIDGLDTSTGVIEEIKTTSEDWTSVPEDYCAQVQHQMYVTGAREARIRQFVCPVPRDLLPSLLEEFRSICMVDEEADRALADWLLEHGTVETWIRESDEDFIERMVARERDFWEYVEQEVPPPEADPEGTVDLSDEPEVYANVRDLAEARARKEEVDDIIEREDDAKKAAREAIEEAVALMDDDPKRVRIGPHKATLHEREHYEFWRIYEDTDEVSGAEWPDEGGQ